MPLYCSHVQRCAEVGPLKVSLCLRSQGLLHAVKRPASADGCPSLRVLRLKGLCPSFLGSCGGV